MARKLIVLFLLLLSLIATVPTAAATFEDVPSDIWYAASVEKLTELNIINGYTDNTFRPNNSITRGEFTKLLAVMSGDNTQNMTTYAFSDVDPELWYAPYIAWAVSNGVVYGMGDSIFAPNAQITRQQMAVMLARYAEKIHCINLPALESKITFTDHQSIAPWAADAVQIMQLANIINGYEDGSFLPNGNATRAETAQMLTNYMISAEQGTANDYMPPTTDTMTISGYYGSAGEAMVPARIAFEALGYTLTYYGASGLTVADDGDSDVLFWNNQEDAFICGNKISGRLSPAINIDGSMWVSARVLGAAGSMITVTNENDTPQVTIVKNAESGVSLRTLSQAINTYYGKSRELMASGIIHSRTDSGSYHGNVRNGEWENSGRYISSNLGLRYYGEWSGGLMNGSGRLILRQGEACIGTFKNGIFISGSYYFADGSKYTGTMTSANMYPTGGGAYTAADGETYVGDWGSYGAMVIR